MALAPKPNQIPPVGTNPSGGTGGQGQGQGQQQRRGERVNNDPSNYFGSAIQPLIRNAMKLYRDQQGFNPYQGQRVAPFNPYQNQAFSGLYGMATGKDPTMGNALSANQNIAKTGGMTGNGAQADRFMGSVVGGQQSVGDPRFYKQMMQNPYSRQQMQAGGTFGQANRGGMNVNGNALYGGLGSNPYVNASAGGYGKMYNQSQGLSNSEKNLAAMASGQYLKQGNPYANANLDRAMQVARANIESDASLAGRTGSSYQAGALADSLGSIASNYAQQQYESDKNLMLGANQQMDSAANARFGQGLSALGGQLTAGSTQNSIGMNAANAMRNTQENNYARQLTGATSLANLGQQGVQNRFSAAQEGNALSQLNMNNRMSAANYLSGADAQRAQLQLGASGQAPTLSDSRFNPYRVLLGAGGAQQNQTQQEYNAARDMWNEQEMSPWQRMQAASGVITGGGLPGATIGYQNANDQRNANQPNPFMQALGYAGGVGQLLGGLF